MAPVDRRKFVLGSGAVVLAASIAGCLPNDDDDEPADDVDDEPEDDVDDEPEDDVDDEPEDDVDDEPDDDVEDDELEEHMAEANGYDGVEDYTGEEEITVEVGDPEGGTNYMFQPAAPEIDEGTTVVWEWIDDDSHSVTQTNGDEFDSDIQADYTFEHTFDEAGTYLYVCVPHEAIGHIGAVVVS